MQGVKLFDLPSAEARAACATGAPVYLPVNPVEYHGPHLSLHNDRLISAGLIRDLHATMFPKGDVPLLLADDLEMGVEPCHGPGSRHVPFQIVRRVVVETCRALVELGAQKIVLMTFHGAPLHDAALADGIAMARSLGARAVSPLNAILRSMLVLEDPGPYEEATRHVEDAIVRRDLLDNLARDFHAGFFETSVALHYGFDSVARGYPELPPCAPIVPDAALLSLSRVASKLGRAMLSRELTFAAHGTGWTALRPFPGYTSRPAVASPEAGAFFAREMIREMAVATRAAFDGEAPAAPIMSWLRALTFGGRIRTSDVPVDSILQVELHRAGAT